VIACRLTEIFWVDLSLFICCMQPKTATKSGHLYPKLIGHDWRRLKAPAQYTGLMSNDDRVLPLARVTP
jgi:hypothetical protein